jgi:Rap1a immunity proteins
MKKLLLVSGMLAFLTVVGVHGQPATTSLTGMRLLKDCRAGQLPLTNQTSYDAGYCDGLVHGVATTAQVTNAITVPDGVTGGQLQLVVIKYLSDHPESLNESDATLMLRALTAVYPHKQ